MLLRIAILALCLGLPSVLCVDMEAVIDMSGYKGSVTFVRIGDDVNVTLQFTTGNNSNKYDKIELVTFPSVFGRQKTAAEVCNSLGAAIVGFMIENSTAIISVLPESIYFHRSVYISSSSDQSVPRLCGTILPTTENVTSYRAKFMGPVSGTVWLRYLANAGTFIYGDLLWADGTDTSLVMLKMFPGGAVDDTKPFDERCQTISGGKDVAMVTVQKSTTIDGTFGIFLPDITTFLPKLGAMVGDKIVACTTLRMVSTKTVTSTMNWEGVKGTFTFTQKSPFDATQTSIALTGLASRTSGYHVHKFPVAQRLSSSENPCDARFVSGHFNPYSVDVNASPSPGTGTADQYEIGDLSGKYGTLANKNEFSAMYTDWNLPLFGPNSIVGRSIVIHNADGSRLMCNTIGYPGAVTTGFVAFKTPAYGTMYIRQESASPDADTSIFIELANQDKTATNTHNWHVHVYPVNDDALTGTCASAGGHYNPSGLSVASPFSTECNSNDPLRCELGDLSGRLGQINIVSTQRTESGKFFFTDEYLPLSGAFSILGRSMVVHDPNAGAPRYACANITQLHPTVAKTTGAWLGTADGSASATITLRQETEFDMTQVTGSFSDLNNLASGYHIHEYTISKKAASEGECSAASVSGHYNPFNWTDPTAATVGTFDQYEVGDLSNKYGLLDSQTSANIPENTEDTNLPLNTFISASDRSIVIHKKHGELRWKCANLVTHPDSSSNGHVISATVSFTSDVTGTIKLKQVVYEDGGSGLTSYEVDVSPLENKANSPQHNWHIHVDPITNQSACADALGHYDPYVAIDNTDYATDCSPTNPRFCEVGDISRKQAKYDIGGGRRVFHDVDTPMHTNFTVLGRSIVFHVSNGGAARYTCANIIPDSDSYTLSFPSTTKFNRYMFTKTVADALGIARLRVVIVHNIDVPITKYGCSRVMVHIAGGAPSAIINQLLGGTLKGLGDYSSTEKCVSAVGTEALGERSDSHQEDLKSYVYKYVLPAIVEEFENEAHRWYSIGP
uniref:uncharacterized protein LOC120336197 isoform X1 n=1 Tax=Styela clava TaxID=7725 RepID=UPI00193AB866|nr:uncharacterized protein LOC120336197 isoform X1 [Styela clava]